MRDDAMPLVRVTPDLPARRVGLPTQSQRGCRSPFQPSIRVSLLDGFGLQVGGREVTLSSCKARALIAYLVLTPGMKETRERLIGLLWSETEDGKARASLRQLLHCLREALDKAGATGIVADKVHVGLDEALFTTDFDELLASLDRGGPGDQLVGEGSFAESFLRGYDDVDPAFRNWLAVKRENTRQLLIRKLEAGLGEALPLSEGARHIAASLLNIDPTHETACQALMRACVAAGNVGGALSAYKRLWERLDQEYDWSRRGRRRIWSYPSRTAAIRPLPTAITLPRRRSLRRPRESSTRFCFWPSSSPSPGRACAKRQAATTG